jgi:hypothetical protein
MPPWMPVVGYEGFYEVSRGGAGVRSVPRTDTLGRKQGGFILRPKTDRKGYLEVHLSKNGVKRMHKVHHLVLEAYVGPRPAGQQCRHMDGDPANNRWPENICWGTPGEDHRDQVRLGTHYNASKECCPKCGGPYTHRSYGGRICKRCQSAWSRTHRRVPPAERDQ